jgi:hypothetical protein
VDSVKVRRPVKSKCCLRRAANDNCSDSAPGWLCAESEGALAVPQLSLRLSSPALGPLRKLRDSTPSGAVESACLPSKLQLTSVDEDIFRRTHWVLIILVASADSPKTAAYSPPSISSGSSQPLGVGPVESTRGPPAPTCAVI